MNKRCTQKGHPFVYVDAKDKGVTIYYPLGILTADRDGLYQKKSM